MNNFRFIAAALAMAAIGGVANGQSLVTKISGHVTGDTTISAVTFLKDGQHPMMSPKTVVPVTDGKFTFEIRSDHPEAFYMVPGKEIWSLAGDWLFFSEGGEINFEIEPGDNSPKVTRQTSMPNTNKLHEFWDNITTDPDYLAYSAFTDSIFDNELFYTPEYSNIEKQLYSTKDESLQKRLRAQLDSLSKADLSITPDGKKSREWGARLSENWEKADVEFAANDSSLCGLYMIARNLWMPSAKDHEEYIQLYEKIYRNQFTGHPYVAEIERIIPVYRHEAATVGCKYTDVEALDADGKMKPISSFINGKVAIIDLWASWCAPCRRNSKSLIPIYEKFAPRGLAIIGLAREMENDKALRKAIEKDGYPWPSLAEINDRNLIWTLYGTPNAPGRTVLVDKEGTIIAIDPTVEELEKKLPELLD